MSAAIVDELVTCALCGHRFEASDSGACASCPIGKGCSLICCPNCGYGAPAVTRSTVAGRVVRAASRLAGRRRPPGGGPRALAEAAPGSQATIETMEEVPARQREQLVAYGLAPGRVVDVLQVHPVTIVRIEHAELAFETALSRAIGIAAATEGTAG